MKWILFAVCDATGEYVVNAWVEDCDVDARNGRGTVMFTRNKLRAKRFDSFEQALEYWRRPSTIVPLRPDGKPNRPLTAFTVEPQRIES